MEDAGRHDLPLPVRPPRGRGLTVAWALFLVIGLPFGLMAALGYLATAGIYLEPLRPLWQPWPPDLVKSFLGVAFFAATLAYLAFRSGRVAGYHSGAVAATAAARNIAEGLRAAPASEAPPEADRTPPDLPVPSPEIPGR